MTSNLLHIIVWKNKLTSFHATYFIHALGKFREIDKGVDVYLKVISEPDD
jgi:hypothetical protein